MRILTNSLAANDVAAVHGGYSRYRGTLLDGGVQIWELKPLAGSAPTRACSAHPVPACTPRHWRSTAETLFVGSFNLDPRSAFLNCEQGVLVSEPVLRRSCARIFDHETESARAWRVTQEDGKLPGATAASATRASRMPAVAPLPGGRVIVAVCIWTPIS